MSEIEGLIKAYKVHLQLPWDHNLAGPQKIWFALYDPVQERRLRFHIPEFEEATKNAGYAWKLVNITDTFAQWMAQHEYHQEYFEEPEDMNPVLNKFTHRVAREVIEALTLPDVDAHTVVALLGLASLFGLTFASAVFKEIASSIRGRLLVFFPGQHHGSIYRLLDARDGWDYLAVPITGVEGK